MYVLGIRKRKQQRNFLHYKKSFDHQQYKYFTHGKTVLLLEQENIQAIDLLFHYCSFRCKSSVKCREDVLECAMSHTLKCTFQLQVIILNVKRKQYHNYLCLVKKAFTNISKSWSWLMKSEKQPRMSVDTFV